MIHIRASLYDPKSPAACESYNEGEQVIGWHVAIEIAEQGSHTGLLATIELNDLCPTCLDEVAHMLYELSREIRKEANE